MKKSLKLKLLKSFIFVGLIPLGLFAIIAFQSVFETFSISELQKLEAAREIKKIAIKNYFSNFTTQLKLLSEDMATSSAAKELIDAFNKSSRNYKKSKKEKELLETYYKDEFLPKYESRNDGRSLDLDKLLPISDFAIHLQNKYISTNKYPTTKKHLLYRPKNQELKYDIIHEKYHASFKKILEKNGYYDIFIVDAESSNIVYSVIKEIDFATNLLKGPHSKSNIADAFLNVIETEENSYIGIVDFEPYIPSYDDPASFIATPIYENGKKIAVLIVQVPINMINSIVNERTGMGETFRTFLVGQDGKLRSDSPTNEKMTINYSFRSPDQSNLVNKNVFSKAKHGGSGAIVDDSNNKKHVLTAYSPIDFLNLQWIIISEVDHSELENQLQNLKSVAWIIGLISCVLLIFLANLVAKQIVDPIPKITKGMDQIIQGDLSQKITLESEDEIGAIADSINKVMNSLKEIFNTEKIDWANLAQAKEKEKEALAKARDEKLKAEEALKLVEELNQDLDKKVLERTSELVESQEQYKQMAEKAEKANNFKSQFIANMSHEIRTPLNAILGFSELLRNHIDSDPVSAEYLKSVEVSGRTLLSLINEILDISKIESGMMELFYDTFDMRSLIKDLEYIFKEQCDKKGISFSLKIPSNFPPYLHLDESKMRQVLLNLISNAIKFTDKGGVEVHLNFDSILNEKINLSIAVKDTGLGIKESEREKVFQTFAQQSEQDYKKFGGTGLGLTIARKITQLMGGDIELESQMGVGSTFTIHIPNIETRESTQDKKVEKLVIPNQYEFKGQKVLIVDDLELNRELLLSYLKQYDLKLEMAKDGNEAINAYKLFSPDLILMDIRMPNMTGFEATEIIREMPGGKETPIFAVTASVVTEDFDRIDKLMDAYIKKPVSQAELVTAMVKVLDCKKIESITSEVIATSESLSHKYPIHADFGKYSVEFDKFFLNDLIQLRNQLTIDDLILVVKNIDQWAQDKNIIHLNQFIHEVDSKIDIFDVDAIEKILDIFLKQYNNIKENAA